MVLAGGVASPASRTSQPLFTALPARNAATSESTFHWTNAPVPAGAVAVAVSAAKSPPAVVQAVAPLRVFQLTPVSVHDAVRRWTSCVLLEPPAPCVLVSISICSVAAETVAQAGTDERSNWTSARLKAPDWDFTCRVRSL